MKMGIKVLVAFLALTVSAHAQTSNGRVSTAAPTYVTGNTAPLSLDAAGNLRVAGSFTPPSLQNVNLTQILGAAPSLTNPLWVFPATGATFPISAASLPLPSGAATQTTLAAILTALGSPFQAGGALAANQSVNFNQIAGTTPTVNNGTAAGGTQRVVIANDNNSIAGAGQGSTGAAAPVGATMAGANSSGNLTPIIQADASIPISASSSGTTQLVALSSGKKIYVIGWDVIAGGTGTVQLQYGTGTNCATGTNNLTGAYPLTAQAGLAIQGGIGPAIVVPAGNALCIALGSSVQMSGRLAYTQF